MLLTQTPHPKFSRNLKFILLLAYFVCFTSFSAVKLSSFIVNIYRHKYLEKSAISHLWFIYCACLFKDTMEVGSRDDELGFPCWMAVRRKFDPNSPFFSLGNIERELLAKQVALEITEDERHQIHNMEDAENWEVCCPIVGCGAQLNSLDDFEDHYHARHTASCSVCSRVYPTSRLLSIHVSESHDSFFQAKVAHGFAMYECLVEGCGMKLKSYKSRQQHLIDKHKFPSSFDFFKKVHPSKKRRQKLQRKQSNLKREEKKEEMEVEEKIEDLVSAVSKLSTSDATPSAVSFGRRHTRGLSFQPRVVQRNRKQDNMHTGGVTQS